MYKYYCFNDRYKLYRVYIDLKLRFCLYFFLYIFWIYLLEIGCLIDNKVIIWIIIFEE